MKRFFQRLVLGALILFSQACALNRLDESRRAFYRGDTRAAVQALSDCEASSENSRLLCEMEQGMALFELGHHRESVERFLRASSLIRELDRISVTEETSAALAGDWAAPYRGEYSEQLWIHTYLMMNFLLLDDVQAALVEGRQALEVFERHTDALEEAIFTRALVGLCFENMGLFDDARLEYRRINPSQGKVWPPEIPRGKGELVVFAAQGRVPVKRSHDLVLPPSVHISIPGYSGETVVPNLDFTENGAHLTAPSIGTDLGAVVRSSLKARMDAVLVRQGVRAGAKEGLARMAGNESSTGEVLARVVLFLLEQADTRSWQTLPGSLKLYRIPLTPGIHRLRVLSSGTDQFRILDRIQIDPGKRIFRAVRF